MYQLILLLHVFLAVLIIALVLVQQGKGATLGAGFGSGASQTVFGSRGSGSFLFRLTVGMAALFFATSIGLNAVATHAFRQERMLPYVPMKHVPATPSPSTSAEPKTSSSTVLPGEIPARKK